MTVANNFTIRIRTLSDWLKNLVPFFQPMRSKTKTYRIYENLTSFTRIMHEGRRVQGASHHIVRFRKNKYSYEYISRGFHQRGKNIDTIASLLLRVKNLVLRARVLAGVRAVKNFKDRGGPFSSDLHENLVFVICSVFFWQWKQYKVDIVLF